jgi:hypothetical protein
MSKLRGRGLPIIEHANRVGAVAVGVTRLGRNIMESPRLNDNRRFTTMLYEHSTRSTRIVLVRIMPK